MKKLYDNLGGFGGIFGLGIGLFFAFFFTHNFNKLSYKNGEKIDDDNLDLRKPIEIEYHDTSTSGVFLHPNNSCNIILPNGKILKLNPDIISEFRLDPNSIDEKTALVQRIDIYYKDKIDIEILKTEAKNIGSAFDFSQRDIDLWFAQKDSKEQLSLTISEPENEKTYIGSCNLINDLYKHGEIISTKRIHYLSIDFRDSKIERLKTNYPSPNETQIKSKIEEAIELAKQQQEKK